MIVSFDLLQAEPPLDLRFGGNVGLDNVGWAVCCDPRLGGLQDALSIPTLCLTSCRRGPCWPRTRTYLWLYSPPTEFLRTESGHVRACKSPFGYLQAPVFQP